MVCPDCGNDHNSDECDLPGTAAATTLPVSETGLILAQTASESSMEFDAEPSLVTKPSSRLIEFPGVTRRAVPPWRKELSERVREVQERRAQEAAAEAEAIKHETTDPDNTSLPQLELLPRVEVLAVNPLVTAALKRIERAHQPTPQDLRYSYRASLRATVGTADSAIARPETARENGAARRAVAATMFDEPESDSHSASIPSKAIAQPAATVATVPASDVIPPNETGPVPEPVAERVVNLVVVPPTAAGAPPKAAANSEASPEKPKAKRIISDDASDPALNYLDFVDVTCPPPADKENPAPIVLRLMAGIIDLLSVGFLSVPFAAVIELRNDSWREPRIAALMAGGAIGVMFIYLTVSTALTGKTLGMRILSLRVIDTRTGLIPTGKQAAGRAIVYILSLTTAGVGFLMALARGEGKTVHDRFSRTAVVRD